MVVEVNEGLVNKEVDDEVVKVFTKVDELIELSVIRAVEGVVISVIEELIGVDGRIVGMTDVNDVAMSVVVDLVV